MIRHRIDNPGKIVIFKVKVLKNLIETRRGVIFIAALSTIISFGYFAFLKDFSNDNVLVLSWHVEDENVVVKWRDNHELKNFAPEQNGTIKIHPVEDFPVRPCSINATSVKSYKNPYER